MLGNKVLAYPELSSPSTPHFAACIFCLEAWTPSQEQAPREHSSPSQYQTEDSARRIQVPTHVLPPPPTAHCSAVGPSTKPLALTVGKTTQAAGYPFLPVRVPRQTRKPALFNGHDDDVLLARQPRRQLKYRTSPRRSGLGHGGSRSGSTCNDADMDQFKPHVFQA